MFDCFSRLHRRGWLRKESSERKVSEKLVALGISGAEERLNNILTKRGDKRMAEDFLSAGSQKLCGGGREWANAHGY